MFCTFSGASLGRCFNVDYLSSRDVLLPEDQRLGEQARSDKL